MDRWSHGIRSHCYRFSTPRLQSLTTETAVVDKPAEEEDNGHGHHHGHAH